MNAEVYLETQRLILRESREDDGPAIHEYAADPEVVRYVEWEPNTWEETQGFLSKKLADRREAPRISYELALRARCRVVVTPTPFAHRRIPDLAPKPRPTRCPPRSLR